jgi:1-aminocyclopropane-1-carboxylate deaminase/D-cysteine desulfhydrase-like pyridoxal-dependent ACC family enzyme
MRALVARYPGLAAAVRRIDLGVGETPLERWLIDDAPLLIKRDDLTSSILGGNKVRALELLLAPVGPNDTLITVGATGSTHALAVAELGRTLGASTEVITWPQETHAVAVATARRLAATARVTPARSVAEAYLRAFVRRVRGAGRVHWIPAGGSVPLGALGQVSAALELAAQLERDGLVAPDTLVVPLGSGGTAAGLLVGLALAGLPTRVLGVQVVPRLVANHARVAGLARRTHALLSRLLGRSLPALDVTRLSIERSAYGGAYGRETTAATAAAEQLRLAGGPRLDATYSAKAFAVALARARSSDERVLFWLTFDGRWLAD